jgi:type IV pilus assembly protein PilC
MINAGVPILQALQIMCEQTENPKLRRKLYSIRNDIEGGSSLFEGLKKHPDIFDALYTNMVNAGETGGILDSVLLRLAEYIEKAARLKAKIKVAMIYPSVVVTVAVGVIAVILIFVIPTFEQMFRESGGALPAPTQFVIGLSNFVTNNFLLLVAGIIAFFVGFKFFYKWERGKILVDRWVLFLPVFGPLLRRRRGQIQSNSFRPCFQAAYPFTMPWIFVSRTRATRRGAWRVDAKRSIAKARPLPSIDETGFFPPMVIHMISMGETTAPWFPCCPNRGFL